MSQKTILIIGDSWGVPNYCNEWNTSFDVHTEFRLKKLGYDVLNFSLNGGSMLETIHYAKLILSGKNLEDYKYQSAINNKRNTYARHYRCFNVIPKPVYTGQKIDWVVWFHTEALRDYPYTNTSFFSCVDFHQLNEMCLKTAYSEFSNLIKFLDPSVKTAIIGGQAPVSTELLQLYHKPTFMIEDWRSELLSKKMPWANTISRTDWIEDSSLSLDEKMTILENHKTILDAMLVSPLFFDNCHPGGEAHNQLTQKLHILFQST